MQESIARLLCRADRMLHAVERQLLDDDEISTLATLPSLIESDGKRWRLTPEGQRQVQSVVRQDDGPVDANRIYHLIRQWMGTCDSEVEEACSLIGLEVSRSRVSGWRRHPTDRKHTKMTMEELEQVLLGLIEIDKR